MICWRLHYNTCWRFRTRLHETHFAIRTTIPEDDMHAQFTRDLLSILWIFYDYQNWSFRNSMCNDKKNPWLGLKKKKKSRFWKTQYYNFTRCKASRVHTSRELKTGRIVRETMNIATIYPRNVIIGTPWLAWHYLITLISFPAIKMRMKKRSACILHLVRDGSNRAFKRVCSSFRRSRDRYVLELDPTSPQAVFHMLCFRRQRRT